MLRDLTYPEIKLLHRGLRMRDELVALFTVCFIKQSATIVVGYYVEVNVTEVFCGCG